MSLGRYLKVTLQKGGAYGVGLTVDSTTISNLFYNPSLNLQSTIFAEKIQKNSLQKDFARKSAVYKDFRIYNLRFDCPPPLE